MSVRAYIEAISLVAPGLADWPGAQPVLRGEQTYAPSELPAYQPTLLPANERRRASATVRLAFRVAEAAVQSSSIAATDLATVFTSSDGDLGIAQRICIALAETQRFISPTDFHNSVHNAAAGYWSIASLATGPATAISAFDHSFIAGLLETFGMVVVEQRPTLLVAYDVPAPQPLLHKRPLQHPVGVGLVLTPHVTQRTLASLSLHAVSAEETPCRDVALEALRLANPAARALPLLQLIAGNQSGSVHLTTANQQCWQVHVTAHESAA